jgi:hypothetical protein
MDPLANLDEPGIGSSPRDIGSDRLARPEADVDGNAPVTLQHRQRR